jgi:hypothetical protein
MTQPGLPDRIVTFCFGSKVRVAVTTIVGVLALGVIGAIGVWGYLTHGGMIVRVRPSHFALSP